MTQPNRAEDKRSRAPGAREARGRGGEDPRSPVAWLVLALVIEQPSHGYEISQRYERRFGSFAPLSVPRVYSALDRLRESGMIEPVALKPVEPAGKQHLMRRSYRATRAGTQAYRRWVAERMHDDPRRAELLGRIASVGLLGSDAVLDVIEQYERSCVEELRSLPSGKDEPDGPADLQELTESLVLDQQRRELRARYEWAVHARQLLEAYEQAAGGRSERSGGESSA